MSVALKDVNYDQCPFCHEWFQEIWGSDGWREMMQDVYESYDENKGGNYCYRKERQLCICAKCHRKVLFGDLLPKK